MKYSDFCYTGIFDEFFNVIWSDNSELFNRISRRHKNLQKKLYRADFSDTICYNFKAKGVEYSVKVNVLRDRRIVCRIFQIWHGRIDNREVARERRCYLYCGISVSSELQSCKHKVGNACCRSFIQTYERKCGVLSRTRQNYLHRIYKGGKLAQDKKCFAFNAA